MEPFQVHAVIQILALLSFLTAIYYARGHNLRMHHLFVYTAAVLLTIGVSYMIYKIGGVPSLHGKLGLLIYVYVLFAALSGKLVLKGKLTRDHHKLLAATAVILLVLEILFGVSIAP